MATRFGLVQTASIIGTAAGGLITQQYGPLAAYGVIGVGLVLLAMYAIAAEAQHYKSAPWSRLRGSHASYECSDSGKDLTGLPLWPTSSYCGNCVTCVRARMGSPPGAILRRRPR